MALATCKVCQKSICLMCVHEEKDGTFCSEACISNLAEVNDWVGTGSAPPPERAAQPQSVAAAVEAPASSSVFEEMPEHVAEVSHPDPVNIPDEPPPAAEPPAASTSNIGNPCYAHPDIRAKAFCRRCRKPICGLCIVENASGMFCSDACVSLGRTKKSGMGTKVAIAAVVLLAAGGAVFAMKPDFFKGLMGGAPPKVDPPERRKPEPKPPKPEVPKPELPKPELPKPELPKPPKPEVPKPELPKPEIPRPELPQRPLPPKPERPKPTIMVHPWTADEPGMWYRVKRGDRLEDVGLKERDAVSYTVALQGWSQGQAQPASEKKVEVEPIELLGEEPVEIEGRAYLCEVRRHQKTRTEWTLVTGRHAGAVLRMESPEGSQEAVRLWEHTVRVGDRSFDCLVVESRQSEGRLIKTWHCPTYPLKALRTERDGVVIEALVDWGMSWTSRPAPK